MTTIDGARRAANCRVVETLYAAIARRDVAAATAQFAEDGVLETPFRPGRPGCAVGKAMVTRVLQGVLDSFRRTTVNDLTVTTLADPDRVLAEWRGDWETVTGRPYRNTYVVLFDLRDGHVVLMREYFNPLVVQAAFPPDQP